MTIVEVDNLSKQFGELTAVDSVSFDIHEGEFISILGPSGSGKSTILRMIAGFETATTGEIRMSGERINQIPPFNRDVNMVFQHLALFPHLSVAENIEYGLKQSGIGKQERQRRVTEILRVVDLAGYGSREIDQLSGGEQQRVALARAIVNEPELVLFDEPLASLDRKLRQHMQSELQRIQEETGVTFLYVTHDQEVAMSVSDRLILLNEGTIEQIGAPEELYNRPATKFVANFIGDVNALTRNELTETDRSVRISETGLETGVTTGDAAVVNDGGGSANTETNNADTEICIRPDHTKLSSAMAETSDIAFEGTVTNKMFQGEQMKYKLDTEFGEFTAQNSADGERFDIGDTAYISFDLEDVFIFRADKARGFE